MLRSVFETRVIVFEARVIHKYNNFYNPALFHYYEKACFISIDRSLFHAEV
jgi:hypothetical protein